MLNARSNLLNIIVLEMVPKNLFCFIVIQLKCIICSSFNSEISPMRTSELKMEEEVNK